MVNQLDGSTPDLQFDRVVPQGVAAPGALSCAYCKRPLPAEYYDVSGKSACAACRGQIEALIATPQGAGPFLTALLFGTVAGIAGAILYYAVIAITNFEIGIVAIAIGFMVGYAVRKGAGGRGGRRFQVLAVVLTYLAGVLAYTPLVVKGAIESRTKTQASASAGAAQDASDARPRPSLVKLVAVLAGFVVALPVMVIAGGFPTSLLSAAIIFFGMQQAWRMTGAPRLKITGPYRVGAPPAPAA